MDNSLDVAVVRSACFAQVEKQTQRVQQTGSVVACLLVSTIQLQACSALINRQAK